MSILGQFDQAPVDDERYTIDYSAWLDTDEALNIYLVEVNPVEPVDPLEVHDSALNVDLNGLTFYVTGGEAGKSYDVNVTVTTDGGPDLVPRTRADCVKFSINAGC